MAIRRSARRRLWRDDRFIISLINDVKNIRVKARLERVMNANGLMR